MQVTGLKWLLTPLAARRGAILTFHRVRQASGSDFAPNAHLDVAPAFLQTVVEWARASAIDIISLDEGLGRLRSTERARRFVILTFDDGFRDNLEIAMPILRAAGAPFTVYVATGFIERSANPWWMTLEAAVRNNATIQHPDRSGRQLDTASTSEKHSTFNELAGWLQAISESDQRVAADWLAAAHNVDVRALVADAFMDWKELRHLADEPLATIGAHTHNHVALAKLARDDARAEIAKSADLLEENLGVRPRHFAYPYGFPAAVGPRDHQLVAELRFDTAVLTTPGVLGDANTDMPTALPRISMNGHFQKRRYLDALASGVPFLPGRLKSGLARRVPALTSTPTVSASSG